MRRVSAVLLLLPALAFATGTPKTPDPAIKVDVDQAQQQQQGQAQAQAQRQGQDQAQEQTQANEQSVTFKDREQVHSAIAPAVFASNPCALGGSAAIGVKGINVGGGRATIDPECERREESRLLNDFGERELAIMHLCNSESLQASLGDLCKPNNTQASKILYLERKARELDYQRIKDSEACAEGQSRILEACQK